MLRLRRSLCIALALLLVPLQAFACGAVALGPRAIPHVQLAATGEDGTAITFIGHASFLIRSPGGITVVTDYNGTNIPDFPPDIATMNNAHSTHWTPHPDPRIKHVLHGWRDDGGPAQIDLTLGDVHVRNLPTNVREWGGGGTRQYGNSIFVFETGGLCIAHLSHLHHLLTPDDVATLGPLDVVMAPLDGAYTLSHEDMAKVLDELHPRLVIGMHFFDEEVMRRFAALVADKYPLKISASATVTLSPETLPARPELLILPGPYF